MSSTVLVVDDIPFVRKTLIQILSNAGYKVVGEAQNGEEAVQQFKRLRPALVTMDLVMPVMSGIEATRHIMKEDKSARVVVLSAMAQEHLVTEAIHAGARDYILKPFQSQDVLKVIAHILEPDGEPKSKTGS